MAGQVFPAIVITDAPETKGLAAVLPSKCPQHPKEAPAVINMAEDMGCPKCGRQLERES